METDLFGQLSGQGSLFGQDRMQPPAPPPATPNPDDIRHRLHAMLAQARAAQAMPWPEREAKVNLIIFPQMANWLPDDEADQLRFEFAREMERLALAA